MIRILYVAVVLASLAAGVSAGREFGSAANPSVQRLAPAARRAPPRAGMLTASLPQPPASTVLSPKPAASSSQAEVERIRQNAIFGGVLEKRFMVELKAHLLLPAGLEVFIYAGRGADMVIDQAALAEALTGRFQFLDMLTDLRYKHSMSEAKRRLDQHDFQGYSLHMVLADQPQSCIVYSDAHTPLYRPIIVAYPGDPSARRCQAVGYTINYSYTTTLPSTFQSVTNRTIAGIILTPAADAFGRYRNTEQPSKLRVDLPASEVYGFTLGHEFAHGCVGFFDSSPILNLYSEERQIQRLDSAFYAVYAESDRKPMPFRVTRKAPAAGGTPGR